MEKLTVRIGAITPRSSSFDKFRGRARAEDISWISRVLEISIHRANKLIQLLKDKKYTGAAYEIEVVLNYRQLARYTAMRQLEGLNKYWKYPNVIGFVSEQVPPKQSKLPVELRPGFRKVSS